MKIYWRKIKGLFSRNAAAQQLTDEKNS
jgi:hypothetical protein